MSDLWRDEKRSPGPWPQGKRAPLAIVAVVVALVAFGHLHNRTVLGVFVVCIGLGAFYCAVRLDPNATVRNATRGGPGGGSAW